jgi:RNA polymerase sigma-70 factor (ECF subfamily)
MKMNCKPEHELVERFNGGDMGAFREIYRKYAPVMQAFASKFTNRATAEDLVQDVFMQIWVARETSPVSESLQAYLFRAVRNRCINHLERLKVKANYETREMIDFQIREAEFFQSPEQLLIRQEQLEQVRREIEKLPEKKRQVFLMAYDDDMRAAEIAEKLHISVRTVETQIYNALKTLRSVFYQSPK